MFIDIFNTNNKYSVIYADPPWEYKESGGGHRGTAGLPYGTMSTKEICELPIRDIAEDKSILFIWATFRKLPECLDVIKAWGFEYYGLAFDWLKTTPTGKPFFGMGYYTRQNNEICLIGVKHNKEDRLKPINRDISCVVMSPKREHSRKPDEIRDYITHILPNETYIELFARQNFEHWDCWGNDTKKFE